MKKIISLLMATVIAIGCLPITTFAAYNNGGKAYSENTDEVYSAPDMLRSVCR